MDECLCWWENGNLVDHPWVHKNCPWPLKKAILFRVPLVLVTHVSWIPIELDELWDEATPQVVTLVITLESSHSLLLCNNIHHLKQMAMSFYLGHHKSDTEISDKYTSDLDPHVARGHAIMMVMRRGKFVAQLSYSTRVLDSIQPPILRTRGRHGSIPSRTFTSYFVWAISKGDNKGHFPHEPRAITLKRWELKRKCPKAVPRLL
jgi:hypothetical protein